VQGQRFGTPAVFTAIAAGADLAASSAALSSSAIEMTAENSVTVVATAAMAAMACGRCD